MVLGVVYFQNLIYTGGDPTFRIAYVDRPIAYFGIRIFMYCLLLKYNLSPRKPATSYVMVPVDTDGIEVKKTRPGLASKFEGPPCDLSEFDRFLKMSFQIEGLF